MAILREGDPIPTREEQQAQIDKQNAALAEERELHKKMRSSNTAEYARDNSNEETTEDATPSE